MPDIARAAAASPWRRSRRAWRRLAVQRYVVALVIYLRFTHAISYRRLRSCSCTSMRCRSARRVGAMLQRASPVSTTGCGDPRPTAPFAIVCSDETSSASTAILIGLGIPERQVVIHVVRNSRAACVVTETMAGHRPSIWVSDLYGAQQGHADLWQVCLDL